MSINKLVIRLELAVLGFVLVVLLLSALDHNTKRVPETGEQYQQIQVAENVQQENRTVPKKMFMDVHIPPRQREIWLGDLDGILERGQLRVLLPFSPTFFFQANGQEMGLSIEILKRYEQFLNDHVVLGDKKLKFIFLPTPQERLLEDLLAGKGDIVAADVQVRSTQEKHVKYISPVGLEIQEVLVTRPDAAQFKSIFNLSGQKITVCANSPYAASLQKLNNTLSSIGKKTVVIQEADPFLKDEDLLEMTAAGLLPMTVIDSYVGEFWSTVPHNLQLHNKIALRTAKELTWTVRADNLLLQESITYFKENNYFPRNAHQALTEYYRKRGGFLKNNLKLGPLERYQSMLTFFEKYGKKYHLSPLLLAALAYQESELDPAFIEKNGAVGIMGLDPSAILREGMETDLKEIRKPAYNIETTARYLRFLIDRYFSSPTLSELDQNLMALAAYKASPEQVIAARKKAALSGYNPDIWFSHTEAFFSEEPERHNNIVQYIDNIYRYFKAYKSFSVQRQDHP